MPTYDYRCSRGHLYEKRERFGSPPEQPCERCGRPARRVIHVPRVVFKGSGWYKTDSRAASSESTSDGSSERTERSKEAQAATAERKAESDSSKKSKSSSDSKSGGSNSSKSD